MQNEYITLLHNMFDRGRLEIHELFGGGGWGLALQSGPTLANGRFWHNLEFRSEFQKLTQKIHW